eukprot:13769249-Alexandrium_andersonii.AAC.1
MQCVLNGQKLRDKLADSDRKKVEEIVRSMLDWVSTKRLAAEAEAKAKQDEVEGLVNPIMQK